MVSCSSLFLLPSLQLMLACLSSSQIHYVRTRQDKRNEQGVGGLWWITSDKAVFDLNPWIEISHIFWMISASQSIRIMLLRTSSVIERKCVYKQEAIVVLFLRPVSVTVTVCPQPCTWLYACMERSLFYREMNILF